VSCLSHSDELSALSALLIVAPTGIYTGRVRRGIDLVLANQADKKTKVRVILIAGHDWIQSDSSYKANYVDKLTDYVLTTWKQEEGLDIVCDDMELPMENEEYLTGWLLAELSLFYKTSRGEAEAFIDLTSAPKEWLFAAINVLNFFPKLELYYVKPKFKKLPKQYRKSERMDEGSPRLETVRSGEARPPLPQWISPQNEKGELNVHYFLFKTIFELAQSIAANKGLNFPNGLSQVWVPIEEESGLQEYRQRLDKKRLPREFQETIDDDSRLMRSIGKHLDAVEPFRLFEHKRHSVRMTFRATMLGQVLFQEERV